MVRMMVWLMAMLLSLSSAMAADTSVPMNDPYQLIRTVAEQAFNRFSAERELAKSEPERLRVIVKEELVPYIDYRYAAFKVMGPHLKKISDQERNRFVDAFRDHLITTYAQLFTKYSGQTLDYAPARKVDEAKFTTVRVFVKEAGKPDITIDFQMRKNSKTGEWRAFDMLAEGVSMLDAKVSELGGLIRQQGITAVTEQLEAKNAQPIHFGSAETAE